MEISTLSRSGLLGLVVGGAVLAVVYRPLLVTRALLVPLGAVAVLLAIVVLRRLDYFSNVLHARLQTGGSGTALHFQVYDFIPQTIHAHPLFGFGPNTFSVYFEFVTGRTSGARTPTTSRRSSRPGSSGRSSSRSSSCTSSSGSRCAQDRAPLAAVGDPVAARVRPAAWGLTAALAGTMAANSFYLTMQFYYFYALALLALATPIVFGRRLASVEGRRTSPPRTPALPGTWPAGFSCRRRQAGPGARRRGGSRLARALSPLRRSPTAPEWSETFAAARTSRSRCRSCSAASRGRRDALRDTPISSMRTGSLRGGRARDGQAVRRPGVGDRRRARPARALARARGPRAGPARHRAVDGARGGGTPARRAGSAHDPSGVRRPG